MTFILLILFIINPLFAEKVWVQRHERQNVESSEAIRCVDSLNCYYFTTATRTMRLYKSTNLGYSWFIQYEKKRESVKDAFNTIGEAYIYDNEYLYMTGYKRISVVKSTDGGKTFERKLFAGIDYNIYDNFDEIVMYNKKLGAGISWWNLIITRDNWETTEIIKTPNFGQSYKRPGTPMFFLDSNNLILLKWLGQSHEFVRYDIINKEWSQYSEPIEILADSLNQKVIYDIEFISDSVAFGVGFQRVGDGIIGRDLIWKTTNKGANWDLIFENKDELTPGLSVLSFRDELNGFTAGEYGNLLITEDGGNTWEYLETPKLVQGTIGQKVTWAGEYPLLASWDGGIYRLEEVGDTTNVPLIESKNIHVRQRKDELIIAIKDEHRRQYDIHIYDLQGNLKQRNELNSGRSKIYQPINISSLNTGMYLFRISVRGQSVQTGKFIIDR